CGVLCFFFQAEDGIRDKLVTGVQTCALPISPSNMGTQWVEIEAQWPDGRRVFAVTNFFATNGLPAVTVVATVNTAFERGRKPGRSEERRVGKECRYRWSPEN